MKSFLMVAMLAVAALGLLAGEALAGNCNSQSRGNCGARNAPRNAPPIVDVRTGRFGRTRVLVR